jgi:hypothetical protein
MRSVQKTDDGQRNKYTRFAWAGGTLFPVVLLCRVSFWFWQEIGFGLHTHVFRVQYNCGVVLVFWLRWEIVFGVMYILSSFLVVVGNSSQNENMFLRKNLIGLLYYDPLANVCILYNLTLFYSVSLIYYFQAATAFDVFGTANEEELLTCHFQYPSLPIFILHFVARIFGHK